MNAERYIGANWPAVHGPSEPRELAIWLLDRGFHGLQPAPSPRPLNWRRLRDSIQDLPFSLAALRLDPIDAGSAAQSSGIGSAHEGTRKAAQQALLTGMQQAASLGINRLVLEPGLVPVADEVGPENLADPGLAWTEDLAASQRARRRSRLESALDQSCRSLHWACSQMPEMELALTGSRSVFGLGEPEGLEAIFEDLSSCRLGYWHDTALTARRQEVLGEEQGDWLDRFSPRTLGISLGDSGDGRLDLPPGSGLVDYPLLSSYWRHAGIKPTLVVELSPSVEQGEIPGVHAFLTKFGL